MLSDGTPPDVLWGRVLAFGKRDPLRPTQIPVTSPGISPCLCHSPQAQVRPSSSSTPGAEGSRRSADRETFYSHRQALCRPNRRHGGRFVKPLLSVQDRPRLSQGVSDCIDVGGSSPLSDSIVSLITSVCVAERWNQGSETTVGSSSVISDQSTSTFLSCTSPLRRMSGSTMFSLLCRNVSASESLQRVSQSWHTQRGSHSPIGS